MKIFRFLLTLVLLSAAFAASADDGVAGTPFFLLSDAAYGTTDTAMVRLEAQNLAAVAEYGGVDVYVYRIKEPLEFLKQQKNLHRIDTRGEYVGGGLSNALARIWDNWWTASRTTWRALFSHPARRAVTAQIPDLRSHPLVHAATPQTMPTQYRPLKAHQLVESFRYPVQFAKVIAAPAGVVLDGSSSGFIAGSPGNVLIPLGRRAPGLYLVEAMVGEHRAATLVFVSDSIAVTKVSAAQMLVWLADRRDGQPVSGARTVWSDGVGVLANGRTDSRGVATFQRAAPEKTVVFGEDPHGGVFVAENFYYDSEIYNTKLYAVTDRPLYRAGETVFVKFLGRDFRSARESSAIAAGEVKLQVFDPNGFPVAGQSVPLRPQGGGDTQFQLPDNAVAGGYELRFVFKDDTYSAAFRVAEYQKPHFEINLLPAKPDFKTNEEVSGQLQLSYPDGKPVANARAELSVRAQRLTMIEGDLGYAGQFPVQLSSAALVTDAKGVASFVLPPAKEPSRYVVSVLATDGAAYRVRATREILIERSANAWTLKSPRAFSAGGESVRFTMHSVGNVVAGAAVVRPVSWDWVRLENRQTGTGRLSDGDDVDVTFSDPGTYTLSLRDAAGNLVAATTHIVSGPGKGIAAPQGAIDMVFDKPSYQPGEVASALITFPQPVEQALFTLERDSVEKVSLMAHADGWLKTQRLSPNQWRVDLPVQDSYGPNITLSVAYVKGSDYVFQNLGLRVEQPRIAVAVQADKPVYAPGDKVTLGLTALIGNKPASGAQLTVSVVDEMVYVLQPEIAPDIFDFFYHPRHNNVRTSASLNFIAYDLAKPPSGPAIPSHRQTHQRAIKVLERPRRDDKDTAFWQPTVLVDASGHATVSFTMPDALSRWRVTVRAITPTGVVGQSTAAIRSDKDFYLKWTSPNWLRRQDTPNASVAIFNQGNQPATVELTASGAGLQRRQSVVLRPGANFVALPLQTGADKLQMDLTLTAAGKTVDALTVPLKVLPLQWLDPQSVSVALTGAETGLTLPADASHIQLQFADSAGAQFRRMMDDLIDYPYGCVEQTSSRLIPYSLALKAVQPSEPVLAAQLSQRLHGTRFRLAQMAGPQATFGWWSAPERNADALLTAYAYYADWFAADALKLTLPAGHFDRLIEVYRNDGTQRSLWHRALMLSWMQEMGLPVRSLAEALGEEVAKKPLAASVKAPMANASLVLEADHDSLQDALAATLVAHVIRQTHGTLPTALQVQLPVAAAQISQAGVPLGDALLMLTGQRPTQDAAAVLQRVRIESPTIDRSLTLLWSYRALNGGVASSTLLRTALTQIAPASPWQAHDSITGQRQFRWPDGVAVPHVLALASAPGVAATAVVRFDSAQAPKATLPVRLERHLFRLVRNASESKPVKGKAVAAQDDASFTLEPVAHDAALQTDQLYLDEIRLTPGAGITPRFGIVEVALPPGATVESTTWGVALLAPGAKAAEALERARFETTPGGYAVPIESLSGPLVLRHLVRAAQTGRFVLPPARFYRMYQPEQKAVEENARAQITIR